METKPNLSNMWHESLKDVALEEPSIERMEKLYLTTRRLAGYCGIYEMEYIGNKHPSATITAIVRTTSWYFGDIVHQEVKHVVVPPGKNNEVILGCTGFQNDSGGYDTIYRRNIDGVVT